MKQPYIVYSLSKGRTTQKFCKSNIYEILNDLESFLKVCTTADIPYPESVQLTIYENDQDTVGFPERIINIAKEQFGEFVKSPIAFHYPSGEPDPKNTYVWTLPGHKLQETLQFITSNSPR